MKHVIISFFIGIVVILVLAVDKKDNSSIFGASVAIAIGLGVMYMTSRRRGDFHWIKSLLYLYILLATITFILKILKII
ncbi:MAG: hypothetical protein M0T70_06045 [Geobacteraceae bacterium]|nr:hypothetical protein [Geobacteraceae bacterium]